MPNTKIDISHIGNDVVNLVSIIDKNLSNENFVSRAPKQLIDQNTERQGSINMELSKIDSILKNIQ